MRRPVRTAALVLAAAATCIATVVYVVPPAGAAGSQSALPKPKSDILVDATTGRVLAGDNVHSAFLAASTVKIMTAVAAVEELPPDAELTATPDDAAVETMRIGLPPGKPWPLDEVMASLMMVSANDAAYTIARTIGRGSLDAWAANVNALAQQLGMHDSTFGDPAGLDDSTSYKGGPSTSAYDLAIAARNALTVPAIARWAAMHEYSFVDPQGVQHHLTNHNKMLEGGAYQYAGLTGFKTGYTDRAQHSLVATATRNGCMMIVAILGAVDGGYAEAGTLLDEGFAKGCGAAGTGVTLPPVAVSPYATRAADQVAFASLAGATVSAPGATGVTVPASPLVLDAVPHGAPATRTQLTATKHGGSDLFRTRDVVIVLILLVAAAVVLRRRAVKRRRRLRITRRRQRAAAMRSGGLPVVDGRYRTGTRVGPPVESHVRVRRGS